MSAPAESDTANPWSVAALLAGVFLNALFLDFVATFYTHFENVWLLALRLSLYSAFLCLAVLYFPLQLGMRFNGGLDAGIGAAMGIGTAWAVRNLLIPIWASVWFVALASFATSTLYTTLVPVRAEAGYSHYWRVLFSAIWLLLIAPAASGPLGRLAQSSIFVVKVSSVLILGLALSTARYLPEAIEKIRAWEGSVPSLEPALLFWVVPPIVASSPLIRPLLDDRQKLRTVMLWGVAIPFCFAVWAALSTLAGASVIENGFRKVPLYSHYAGARFNKLGWVKLLLLTFTLLTASRFAANLAAHTLARRGGIAAGTAITAGLLLLQHTIDLSYWDTISWLRYISIPFAPLTGVLCGVYAVKRIEAAPAGLGERICAIVAWLTGCAVASSPMWMPAEHERPFFLGNHLLGWLAAFLLTWLTLRLYPLMQNSVVRERR